MAKKRKNVRVTKAPTSAIPKGWTTAKVKRNSRGRIQIKLRAK